MNKRELIVKVAEKKTEPVRLEAAKAVNAVIRANGETLKKGENILVGTGVFRHPENVRNATVITRIARENMVILLESS